MTHPSFIRIASALPADASLSDFEPLDALGNGRYGVSALPSVSDKSEAHIRSSLRQAFKRNKTCGYAPLQAVRAVFFDMDSTVVAEETIVELARYSGKEKEVAEVTERAMLGQLDFAQALKERVAHLKGVPAEVCHDVAARMTLNKGIKTFAEFCRELGVPIYLVSGGFLQVAIHIQNEVGFDAIHANSLEEAGGLLTGRTTGTVVDGLEKLAFVKRTCAALKIQPSEVATVGDGANDLPMMQASGVSIGFCPKPLLLDHVHALIGDGDHSFLGPLLFGRSCDHRRLRQ